MEMEGLWNAMPTLPLHKQFIHLPNELTQPVYV